MPRFGKGKPMADQARAVLKGSLALTSRHAAKQSLAIQGSRSTGAIHSLRTFEKYTHSLAQAGEWARRYAGIRYLKGITPELAQRYLEDRRAAGIGQKQLDADRNALEFITGKGRLARVQPLTPAEKTARAYTPAQVRAIRNAQRAANALSTSIAQESGVRAHELLTLRRASEASVSGHRPWSAARFKGREGVRYVVIGKGGLRREVLLSNQSAKALEAYRLDEPRQVTDRGIHYQQFYDISGGNRWSKSFGEASARVLGWSHGAHGLRHSYVQERMAELQALGKNYYAARAIIAQEMGHFRGDVVEAYLR